MFAQACSGSPLVRFLVQPDAVVASPALLLAAAARQGFEVINLTKLASALCTMRWSSTCLQSSPDSSPAALPCSLLHASVPDLRRVTTLDLSNSNLTSFPTALFSVSETLSFLNLGGNRISGLPSTMGSFTHLHTLFFAGNAFTTVPEVLGSLPALTMLSFKSNAVASVPPSSLAPSLNWLILTDNVISELPDSIGACIGMRKLMLANNRLSSLPPSMAKLKALELLRLAANRFDSLPAWLFSLPRLSWLAIAGNPCCEQRTAGAASTSTRIIPWSALRVGHVLGSGASGVVHAVEVVDDALDVPTAGIALKLFKGEATSDGLPADEMAAAVRVGVHPNTIQVCLLRRVLFFFSGHCNTVCNAGSLRRLLLLTTRRATSCRLCQIRAAVCYPHISNLQLAEHA